jgi:HPt (histidine-containing phosphotransfer) domain-containing protein
MNDFVPKPVSKALLHDVLKRWLRPTAAAAQRVPKAMVSLEAASSLIGQGDAVVFDRAGVMQRLEGDRELAKVVMEVFLDDLPRQLECLRDLVASGDAQGTGRQAHSIKGAAANVGGERMRRVAMEMERAADAGNLTGVKTRMDKLQAEFRLLKDALQDESSGEVAR